MRLLSDKALIDVYMQAKQLKLSNDFIFLIEQEIDKSKLVR
ncbi:sporulation histidine kinase inhibitor Sda [Rossellomorea sp. AcN35-11]|nr:sporulation histidine kinase inhibitor Sda [Rossellomorea aquimaris]WJV31521.1 sporulation histidine kinase inhibitor Sda [Rossellomorea sp. AcN35-11]